MTTALLSLLAGMLFTMGVYLLATSRPRRKSLTERLQRYHVRDVAEEAEEWLRGR